MAKVIIFSGAGISAESGISTFRDSDGLWENHNVEDVCTDGSLQKNRKLTIDFYDMLRVGLKTKEPNHAHKMIAKLKSLYPNDIDVITQNIDNLFERAGCEEVLHLHGFLTSLRCMDDSCDYTIDIGYEKEDESLLCKKCGELLRPNIVFFHEPAPMYQKFALSLKDCKMLIVIGTSGNVIDVNRLITKQMDVTILNNLERSHLIYEKLFTKILYSKATEAIDEIAIDVEDFLAT